MSTTVRVATIGGIQAIEISEDKTLEQVAADFEAQGLALTTASGDPVNADTQVQDGDTLAASPKDAKLG